MIHEMIHEMIIMKQETYIVLILITMIMAKVLKSMQSKIKTILLVMLSQFTVNFANL